MPQRIFEWFGLRDNPADDDALAIYLIGAIAVMLLAGRGPQQEGAVGTWWSLLAGAVMALLVARAVRPRRHPVAKAIGGVAAIAFTPLGIALVLGFDPAGVALGALVAVPALLAGLVVAGGRRGAASPRAGR